MIQDAIKRYNRVSDNIISEEGLVSMTKKLSLYFIRHGQTYLNKYGRMQGWSDAPLTPEGLENVKASGRGLSGVEFIAAYSSDLQRTVATANAMLTENKHAYGLQLEQRPEFRETFFGSFEGLDGKYAWGEIAAQRGLSNEQELFSQSSVREILNATRAADPTGDAEDFQMFWSRVEQGFLDIINRHRAQGGNIFIVAHGVTIRNIIHELDPSITEQFVLDNASVSILSYEQGLFKAEKINDTSHFKK